MVLSFVTSTSTEPMRKLTSAGPVLTRGVAVADPIGICIEFCAVAGLGSIKPPPAKALASKNCLREKRFSSCSLIVRKSFRKGIGKAVKPRWPIEILDHKEDLIDST